MPDLASLTADLTALGIAPGDVLVVHTAFARIGPVDGGPLALIAALRDVLGPDGTLVMPTMADSDDEPFDAATAPCLGMGIVAETFRSLPGVLRCDSPHGFAAIGPHAARITAPQPHDVPHGPDSPVGRVAALDGKVLLLGVGHDANTTLHCAENLAGVRYGLRSEAHVFIGGVPTRVPYLEVDHCCRGFERMDGWLEEEGLLRRVEVGRGEGRLMRSRDVLMVALGKLAERETVFLCEPGTCGECDAARVALPI